MDERDKVAETVARLRVDNGSHNADHEAADLLEALVARLAEVEADRDAWRTEPESNDAWCAGNQFALDRLCAVLKVDPATVDWDGSDGSLTEEADSLIWRIVQAHTEAAESALARARADQDAMVGAVVEEAADKAEDFSWDLPLFEDAKINEVTDDVACEIQRQAGIAIRALRPDAAAALDMVRQEARKEGYLAGFNASGEGWNGEHPFEGEDPEADAYWAEKRDAALAAMKGPTP